MTDHKAPSMSAIEQAIEAVRNATPKEREFIELEQAAIDRRVGEWESLLQSVRPESADMRKALLMNPSTDPHPRFTQLALAWMQRAPQDWDGWYPGQCIYVAEVLNIGESV